MIQGLNDNVLDFTFTSYVESENLTILFNVFQSQFSVNTRHFELPNGRTNSITYGMRGFRIVQNWYGNQYAEYHVIVCSGSQSVARWRRYSEFKTLAKKIQHLNASTTTCYPNALKAWETLQQSKKFFLCLEVKYLYHKFKLLDDFVRELLFEADNPRVLMEFVTGKPNHTW